MNIPWELIWPILIKWIESCIETERLTDEQIKSRLKSPDGRDWLVLWLKLRRAGQSISEASATCHALRQQTWGEGQYQALIDEARAA